MTTEPTQPAPVQTIDAGESTTSTLAPSQGHRRRRRRRKSKGSVASGTPAQAQAPEFTPTESPSQPVAISAMQQRPEGGSFKSSRRKKRRNKQQQNGGFKPEPGNSIMPTNGYSSRKKTGRQKGPREFVGPMDHSYRAINGNVSDGPPATIAQVGNGNFYADATSRIHPVPAIAADAPSRIFFVIEDLFFVAKIQEVSRKLGVKVEFVKGDKDIVAHLAETADPEHPSLVVFDLNNAAVKSLTLIPKVKSKLKKAVSVIGFLSHIQGDLKIKAIEAGCDTVMPRSAFSQSLPNLLRRYGIDDEDEHYPQPM